MSLISRMGEIYRADRKRCEDFLWKIATDLEEDINFQNEVSEKLINNFQKKGLPSSDSNGMINISFIVYSAEKSRSKFVNREYLLPKNLPWFIKMINITKKKPMIKEIVKGQFQRCQLFLFDRENGEMSIILSIPVSAIIGSEELDGGFVEVKP